MHNWSKGWALRSLNIGVSIKEETIFTGANYYHFLTLMIAKSKKKKKKNIIAVFIFFFGLKYATVLYRYIRSSKVLTTKSKEQRTKNKGATKTSHKKMKRYCLHISTFHTFSPFFFFNFSPFWWACFGWI